MMTRADSTNIHVRPLSKGSPCGKQPQRGFTMLEILIAIVIVLLGVLGLAGLIVRSNQAELESYQRVQALLLAQDMADRINVNRKVASCYANGATGVQLGTAGAGHTGTPACLVGTDPQQQQRAVADMNAWDNQLTGTAEVQSGSNIGAMIGARGCITQISAATETYIVAVAWQGLATTAAPGNTCAQNLYGNDALRRVVTLTFRIGDLL
jgi:type IV pilus assembly protein PilV